MFCKVFLILFRFDRQMIGNVCLALFHLLRPMLVQDGSSFRRIQNIMTEGPKVKLKNGFRSRNG